MYREVLDSEVEAPSGDPVHQGLIGILYGASGLHRPRAKDLATSLELDWDIDAQDRGRNWSEEWRGFLIPPIEGGLILSIEADQPVRLQVRDEVVPYSTSGPAGQPVFVEAEAGQPIPIRLVYDHDQGLTGRLRIRWSLDATRFEPIPAEALRHSDRERRWVDRTLFLSEL